MVRVWCSFGAVWRPVEYLIGSPGSVAVWCTRPPPQGRTSATGAPRPFATPPFSVQGRHHAMPPPPGRTNATDAPRPVATPQRSPMPDAPLGIGFILDLAEGEEQQRCAVSLESFAPDDENNRVVRLGCSHLLHEKCHLELVQAGDDQCPVCRSPCYNPRSALDASGAVAAPAPIEVSGGELPETMQLETFLETLIGDSVGEGEGEVAGAAPIADSPEKSQEQPRQRQLPRQPPQSPTQRQLPRPPQKPIHR